MKALLLEETGPIEKRPIEKKEGEIKASVVLEI